MNMLKKLIGCRVIRVSTDVANVVPITGDGKMKIEIPVTLVFADYTLNIYNSFVIYGIIGTSLSLLEDLTVQGCEEINTEIILYLDNSVELIIDMSDKGYNGPEALSLYGPDSLIVVWD
jgi:hypothetical protein